MKKSLLLIFIIFPIFMNAQQVTYVGHRGASYLAPENTLSSIQLAWELGAPAAECDIMLTKDKKVIIFHDKKGNRLTGLNFTVKDSNYDEIKNYPLIPAKTNLKKYSNETIPLLSQVISTIPEDKTLVIEIKTGPEILPYLKKVISEHWKSGSIVFIAFDFETIMATKDQYPEIPCYYLSAFKSDINKKFPEIRKSKLDGVNLRHKIIDKALVQQYNEIGKEVWCWTVNDPADARRLINAGVSAITTDRPKWLPEQL